MLKSLSEPSSLFERALRGDGEAWGAMLTEHSDRLRRIVAFRLNARLRGRVDPADVVQDALLEASAHRETYFRCASAATPVFLWLRGIVSNKLLELHRHHLGTRMRDASREVRIGRRAASDATSVSLVAELTGHATGPTTAAARAEVQARLHEALNGMDAADREVLALRHFEQLTNCEAAGVLGIQERAAAKRYLRALKRLKDVLTEMPAGLTGLMS